MGPAIAVTDRDWAQESLRLALLAGGFGTWEWDVLTGLVHGNATLEAIYGLPAGSFTGTVEDYRKRVHPEDRAQSAKVLDEAIAARSTFETEHRVVRPDGTVRWTHGWARPRLDHQGAVSGFVGVVADITDRRVADDERERLLADAMEARAEADVARRDAEWAAAPNATSPPPSSAACCRPSRRSSPASRSPPVTTRPSTDSPWAATSTTSPASDARLGASC